jgi:hypothetical protein
MYYLYICNYNMEMVWKFEVMCDKSDRMCIQVTKVLHKTTTDTVVGETLVKSMHILKIKL